MINKLPDMTKSKTPSPFQQTDPFHIKTHVDIDTIGAYNKHIIKDIEHSNSPLRKLLISPIFFPFF